MKPKILFIMHLPPPIHGAAMMGQYIHDSRLINESFDCLYINPSASNNISEVGKLNMRKFFFFLKLQYRIVKALIQYNPDLCYYTPTSDGKGIYRDMLTIGLFRLFHKKFILHFHNKGVSEYSQRPYTHWVYRRNFKKAKVILLAKELQKDVKQFVSSDSIFFLPNGIPSTINEAEYHKVLLQRNQTKRKVRFLFLSNMLTEKGIWVLLKACQLLKEGKREFECHYVGNTGDVSLNLFRKSVEALGLQNRVFVHGPKYGKDKKAYFTQSDVFVFPTYYHGETFGLVLLEAMEYGLPCISTFEGGIPSVVEDAKTGFLVPQRDANVLSDKMAYFIEHPEMRSVMGDNGRKRFLSCFTIDKFEQHLRDILDSCVNKTMQ